MNPAQILEMDLAHGVSLLTFALEEEENQKLFTRWVQSGAHTAMSFEDFKLSLTRKPAKATEEILDDVGNILAAFEAAR